MPLPIFNVYQSFPAFALVLFRISGLILTAPMLSSRIIPARIKAAFVFSLALVLFPTVAAKAPSEITLASALVGGVGEIMIGAVIGLGLAILLSAAEVGGLMIGRQAGIALSNVFDPVRNDNVSTVGQIYSISFTLIFLGLGGHRAMVAAVLDTYEVIPLLSFQFNETMIILLVELLAASFVLGIRLAGPVLIALFMTGTALGILSKTMPQLNILTVGFAVRLAVALLVAGLSLTACEGVIVDGVWNAVESIRAAFGLVPDHTMLVN